MTSTTLRLLLALIAAVNGGWMLVDGIHVLRTGRYIGNEIGPWRHAVRAVGIDPLRMGIPFVVFGTLWLVVAVLVARAHPAALWMGLAAGVITLWYASVGTILSIAFLIGLALLRSRLGA